MNYNYNYKVCILCGWYEYEEFAKKNKHGHYLCQTCVKNCEENERLLKEVK